MVDKKITAEDLLHAAWTDEDRFCGIAREVIDKKRKEYAEHPERWVLNEERYAKLEKAYRFFDKAIDKEAGDTIEMTISSFLLSGELFIRTHNSLCFDNTEECTITDLIEILKDVDVFDMGVVLTKDIMCASVIIRDVFNYCG